jgi:hypothetical protein
MSTRVTSAASMRAKEALIQLLFPQQQAKRYTHLQLRMAYLQRVHMMHPDKQLSTSEYIRDQSAHEKFVQLQNAWEAYNLSARMFLRTTNAEQGKKFDDDGNNDFIMFGVGCSFSDSPEEKERRNEIMEQACKGWFPAAALPHSDGEMAKAEIKSHQQSYTKLSDDNMFMEHQKSEASSSTNNLHHVQTKKSLVQNVENYRNRRRRNK